jgi:cation:H+ antiporter
MLERFRHPLAAVAAAMALTIPFLGLYATHSFHLSPQPPGQNITPVVAVLTGGAAILGAAFLLAWAAETAEKDVPTAFAIAVLAVLAVAPEYAVDALYAWQAGADPGPSEAASLAIANMTGANRILIGVGWAGIVLYTIYRAKQKGDPAVEHHSGFLADRVIIDREISIEIAFLLAATAYAFFIPLGGTIGIADTLILVGLYAAYIAIIIRGEAEPSEETVGVPEYFQQYSKVPRIGVVLLLFAFSGLAIFWAVHPFANGLEALGTNLGIPEFFMIQWLAPLASESPELVVVAYLVNKARSTAGFNALISSKLNQWTLLIGTLAVVYSIASGHLGGLPISEKQVAEIWITAAQSFFALAILSDFEISAREAVVLFLLFISQVLAEFYVIQTYADPTATNISITILYAYTVLYMILGIALFIRHRENVRDLLGRTATNAREAVGGSGQPERAD